MNKLGPVFLIPLFFLCLESKAQVLIGPVVDTHLDLAAYGDKDVKDYIKVRPSIGYSVGGSISFRVQKRFFLQTSVMYTRKKKYLKETGKEPYDADFSNESKYNYLEMPILYTAEFKGRLGGRSNKEFKWYLGIGPTVSYWLGGKGVLKDGDLVEANVPSLPYTITFGRSENVKKGEMNITDPNRVQLGLNISAGLILEPVGFNKFMLMVRYEMGHSYLSRTSDGYFGGYDGTLYYKDELQVRLQTIHLSLNYFIDLKTDQRKRGKSTSKVKKGRSKN